MIEARKILDSVSPEGKRLFCVKCRYPKFIHGELMTHRVLSRNASSSRAVPTRKLIEEVRSDALRATFVHWGAEQKGMGADAELEGEALQTVQRIWQDGALHAARLAEEMARAGAAKQLVNRLLEPFSHINVLVSATEWDNFFGLRLDKAAQPEMRALAEAVWREWNESEPQKLHPDEWHLPFVDHTDLISIAGDDDRARVLAAHVPVYGPEHGFIETLCKVSVARCARVSYESFETGRRSTVAEDLALYDRLVGSQPMHASPAEHQATPDIYNDLRSPPRKYRAFGWQNPEEHGNFVGWRQHRKTLAGEDRAPLPAGYVMKER